MFSGQKILFKRLIFAVLVLTGVPAWLSGAAAVGEEELKGAAAVQGEVQKVTGALPDGRVMVDGKLLPGEIGKITFEQLKANSDRFNQGGLFSTQDNPKEHKFPTDNNAIEVIADDDQNKKDRIAAQANSVYPITHDAVHQLIRDFLAYKTQSGSAIEKKLYENMSEEAFVTRLLTNRPLMFLNPNDTYLLRDGKSRGQSNGACFELIGTDREGTGECYVYKATDQRWEFDTENQLVLQDYLSYDEMQIAALLGVSVPTYFINNGNRFNEGSLDETHRPTTKVINSDFVLQPHQEEGVYVGLVGARFEKPEVMEYAHMYITENQNQAANGYGKNAVGPKAPLFKIWAKFYGIGDYFPTYEDAQTDQSGRFVATKNGFLDTVVYKKRLELSILPFLKDADARAAKVGKKAYCYVVGLGTGAWAIDGAPQEKYITEVFDEILSHNKFDNISDIEFGWFTQLENSPDQNVGGVVNDGSYNKAGNNIKIIFSRNNPADPLVAEENKLLVAMYAWDSNSYPGNEYWLGSLAESGDPAAACCSTISELQNPLINPNVSGETLKSYSSQAGGAASAVDYSKYQLDLAIEANKQCPIPKGPEDLEQWKSNIRCLSAWNNAKFGANTAVGQSWSNEDQYNNEAAHGAWGILENAITLGVLDVIKQLVPNRIQRDQGKGCGLDPAQRATTAFEFAKKMYDDNKQQFKNDNLKTQILDYLNPAKYQAPVQEQAPAVGQAQAALAPAAPAAAEGVAGGGVVLAAQAGLEQAKKEAIQKMDAAMQRVRAIELKLPENTEERFELNKTAVRDAKTIRHINKIKQDFEGWVNKVLSRKAPQVLRQAGLKLETEKKGSPYLLRYRPFKTEDEEKAGGAGAVKTEAVGGAAIKERAREEEGKLSQKEFEAAQLQKKKKELRRQLALREKKDIEQAQRLEQQQIKQAKALSVAKESSAAEESVEARLAREEAEAREDVAYAQEERGMSRDELLNRKQRIKEELTTQQAMAEGKLGVDKQHQDIASVQVSRLQQRLESIDNRIERTKYLANVRQLDVLPQENNDCGFRAVRNAALAYLWATKQLTEANFKQAIDNFEAFIISLDYLKRGFVKPAQGRWDTSELELQEIINAVIMQLSKVIPSYTINASNITIIPLLLGLDDLYKSKYIKLVGTKQTYAAIILNTPGLKAAIENARSQANYQHAFIINSDQTMGEGFSSARGSMMHWLTILVKKENGKFNYVILDSLNKPRVQLQEDLAYLINQFNFDEAEKESAAAEVATSKEKLEGRKAATDSARREYESAREEAQHLKIIADSAAQAVSLSSNAGAIDNAERTAIAAAKAGEKAENLRKTYEGMVAKLKAVEQEESDLQAVIEASRQEEEARRREEERQANISQLMQQMERDLEKNARERDQAAWEERPKTIKVPSEPSRIPLSAPSSRDIVLPEGGVEFGGGFGVPSQALGRAEPALESVSKPGRIEVSPEEQEEDEKLWAAMVLSQQEEARLSKQSSAALASEPIKAEGGEGEVGVAAGVGSYSQYSHAYARSAHEITDEIRLKCPTYEKDIPCCIQWNNEHFNNAPVGLSDSLPDVFNNTSVFGAWDLLVRAIDQGLLVEIQKLVPTRIAKNQKRNFPVEPRSNNGQTAFEIAKEMYDSGEQKFKNNDLKAPILNYLNPNIGEFSAQGIVDPLAREKQEAIQEMDAAIQQIIKAGLKINEANNKAIVARKNKVEHAETIADINKYKEQIIKWVNDTLLKEAQWQAKQVIAQARRELIAVAGAGQEALDKKLIEDAYQQIDKAQDINLIQGLKEGVVGALNQQREQAEKVQELQRKKADYERQAREAWEKAARLEQQETLQLEKDEQARRREVQLLEEEQAQREQARVERERAAQLEREQAEAQRRARGERTRVKPDAKALQEPVAIRTGRAGVAKSTRPPSSGALAERKKRESVVARNKGKAPGVARSATKPAVAGRDVRKAPIKRAPILTRKQLAAKQQREEAEAREKIKREQAAKRAEAKRLEDAKKREAAAKRAEAKRLEDVRKQKEAVAKKEAALQEKRRLAKQAEQARLAKAKVKKPVTPVAGRKMPAKAGVGKPAAPARVKAVAPAPAGARAKKPTVAERAAVAGVLAKKAGVAPRAPKVAVKPIITAGQLKLISDIQKAFGGPSNLKKLMRHFTEYFNAPSSLTAEQKVNAFIEDQLGKLSGQGGFRTLQQVNRVACLVIGLADQAISDRNQGWFKAANVALGAFSVLSLDEQLEPELIARLARAHVSLQPFRASLDAYIKQKQADYAVGGGVAGRRAR